MDPVPLRNVEDDRSRELGKKMAALNVDANTFTLECLEIQPTDHILEIGCGTGEALAEAALFTPRGFVAGLDHSVTVLKMAQERNSRAVIQDRIELTLGEAAQLPYKEESFHKVYTVNGIYFWEFPAVQLQEIYRVLKEGGRVGLFLAKNKECLEEMKQLGIFHAHSVPELQQSLRELGFQKISVKTKILPQGEGLCILGEK